MIGNNPASFFMFGMRLNKGMFFDREIVRSRVAGANKKFLNRAGYMVRQTARRSMRFRKKSSLAGTPPSAHRKDKAHPHGPLLRDRLFYQFDWLRDTVVVGPEALRQSKNPVPAILEFGGQAIVKTRHGPPKRQRRTTPATQRQRDAFKRLLAQGRIQREKVTYTYKPITVAARPYMRPALQRELPKFPSMFVRYFGYPAPAANRLASASQPLLTSS